MYLSGSILDSSYSCKPSSGPVESYEEERPKIFIIIQPTSCTNFSNLFLDEILHVSDISSVHHQEFFTVYTAMV